MLHNAVHWMKVSSQYASAVKLVTDHTTFRNDPSWYLAPTVFLTGHALELALKACLLHADPSSDVKRYGHDLWILWQDEKCAHFRAKLFEEANQVYGEMIELGVVASYSRLTSAHFDELIHSLNYSYGSQRNYAVKYPSTENAELRIPRAAQIALPLERVTRLYAEIWA
jgi:pentatricopeptide repeat protein